MKFKNLSFYEQRKIDDLLRSFRVFARVYVNNIIMFSRILNEHIFHLHSIFQLFETYEINLNFKKSFLKYSIIVLLRQKIDAFDLIIAIDKLNAIVKLDFSYTLKKLKIYLDLTEWFRNFVLWYAQKVDALQRRKTLLLRQSLSIKSTIRKTYFRKIVVDNSIIEELEFYCQLQKTFSQITFLIHFFVDKVFYINIDVFKRRDFKIMIYYFKSNVNSNKSKRIDIESILFFSRMLNIIETKY